MKNLRNISIVLAVLLVTACAYSDSDTPAPDKEGPMLGEVGGMCGGIAGIECADPNAYCALEAGACKNGADHSGVCKIKPEMCTMEYAPVCGCDGVTYSNSCAAAGAGASVAHEGKCLTSAN